MALNRYVRKLQGDGGKVPSDALNGSDPLTGPGAVGPWLSLSHAVDTVSATDDTIAWCLNDGVYNVANGETFPIDVGVSGIIEDNEWHKYVGISDVVQFNDTGHPNVALQVSDLDVGQKNYQGAYDAAINGVNLTKYVSVVNDGGAGVTMSFATKNNIQFRNLCFDHDIPNNAASIALDGTGSNKNIVFIKIVSFRIARLGKLRCRLIQARCIS